jgi:hypothetical protein
MSNKESDTANIKIKNNFSDPVEVPGTTGDGVVKFLPIRAASDWIVQVDSGCISAT